MEKDTGQITLPLYENGDDSDYRFHSVLLDLKKLDKSNLHEFLRNIITVVSNTLDTERVSIWFFTEDRTGIYCDYLYLKEHGRYINEEPLKVSEYPSYFNAILSQLYIHSPDALKDPNTSELADTYLIPRKIKSMLDIPVHYRDETIGIICLEAMHYRRWKREEIDFTAAISTLVSTALEIDVSKKKEHELQESQRFLGTLISNLPGYVYRVEKQNGEWKTKYISDGVYELTGYPTKAFTDGSAYYINLVYDEDKEHTRKSIFEALETQKPYKITYRLKTIDGRLLWVWEQGRGIYSETGELIATEGFITDITEKKLFEEELIKRNRELAVLNRSGQTLSMLAEPEEIINNIRRMLGDLFDTKNLYIALYDPVRNYITFPYYSIEGKQKEVYGRPFEDGLTEYVIKSSKPVIVNSSDEEFYVKNNISLIGQDAESIISAPMVAGENVIGVITLQDYYNKNAYSNSQLDILITLAAGAAIAIENSNLYAEIKKSLREKDILLQEVHHRVKNNLQIMSSLVKLQSHYFTDEKTLEIMKEIEGRIQSMAIVHSKLYNTKDYEHINFADYVKNLTDNFWNTFGFKLKDISFNIDILDIRMNIDTAIPCGLIINELVSNAIKYAFPEGQNGEILISLQHLMDKTYQLTVSDNGIGIPENLDLNQAATLGMQLVNLLTKQMNGHLQIKSSPGKGVCFTINFEEAVYKSRR